jgi:hypothetical protein
VTDYVFVYSGGSMPETEEEQAAVMKAWNEWFGEIGGALKDGGNPFTPAAKTVKSNGSVSDGASGTPLSGYSIVQADSLDAAVAIAKKSPVLMGGADITVYETFEVMM